MSDDTWHLKRIQFWAKREKQPLCILYIKLEWLALRIRERNFGCTLISYSICPITETVSYLVTELLFTVMICENLAQSAFAMSIHNAHSSPYISFKSNCIPTWVIDVIFPIMKLIKKMCVIFLLWHLGNMKLHQIDGQFPIDMLVLWEQLFRKIVFICPTSNDSMLKCVQYDLYKLLNESKWLPQ